jgi:hypothetical protein
MMAELMELKTVTNLGFLKVVVKVAMMGNVTAS